MNEEDNKLFEAWLSRWQEHTNKSREELLEMAIVKEHLKDLESRARHKEELHQTEAQKLSINCS